MTTILKCIQLGLVPLIYNTSSSNSKFIATKADLQLIATSSKNQYQPKAIRNININLFNPNRYSFLLGKHSFHTASILFSDNNPQDTPTSLETESTTSVVTESSTSSNHSVIAQLRERRERLIQSESRGESTDQQGTNSNLDSFSSFEIFSANSSDNSISDLDAQPWLRADSLGSTIYPHNPIRLVNGMGMLRIFLRTQYNIDPNVITSGLLTRILNIFQDNPNITVSQFFNEVRNLQAQDPNFFNNLIQSENVTESTETEDVARPLGDAGDISLNQIITSIQNFRLPDQFNRVSVITVHPGHLLVNSITYAGMVGGFVRFVHNRPYSPNLSPIRLEAARRLRRHQLIAFAFIGAPFIQYSLRYSAISWADTLQIEFRPNEPNSNNTNNSGNSNIRNSTLLLTILTQFKDQKPKWFILIAILIIVILLSLKFVGILKIWFVYSVICMILAISYQLVNLLLLHLAYRKKTNVPLIFPKFIRNWLQKEFDKLSQYSKEEFIFFINEFYIYLAVYLVAVILASLFIK